MKDNNTRSSFKFIPWLVSCIFTTHHKNIGLLYWFSCFCFGFIIIQTFNISYSNSLIVVNNYKFNNDVIFLKFIIITIFYVFFPALFCSLNSILVPLLSKCEELIFPKIHNISFWIFCLSFLIMLESILCEINPNIYTFYLFPFTSACNWEYLFTLSLYLYNISFFSQAINYAFTIIKFKKRALSIIKFTILVTSLYLIIYLPLLSILIESILFKNNLSYICFLNEFWEKKYITSINFQLYWFFFHPMLWIFIGTCFGFGIQILMNKINIPSFFKTLIKILILFFNFFCLFFWLKLIFLEYKSLTLSIEYYFNFIWIGFIVLLFIYFSCLLILINEKNKLEFNFPFYFSFYFSFSQSFLITFFLFWKDFYDWFFMITFYYNLVLNSFIIISGSVFFWIFTIYRMELFKVLTYIYFILLIIGLIMFANFYFYFKFIEYNIIYLKFILWSFDILFYSLIIFLISILLPFLSKNINFFFKWCANNYIMFIKSIRLKHEFPTVFISETFLLGSILTRIFLWGQNFSIFERIFRLMLFSTIFVYLLVCLLYFPYALTAFYKEKSLFGKYVTKFLLIYGDEDLINDFLFFIHH